MINRLLKLKFNLSRDVSSSPNLKYLAGSVPLQAFLAIPREQSGHRRGEDISEGRAAARLAFFSANMEREGRGRVCYELFLSSRRVDWDQCRVARGLLSLANIIEHGRY